jgi:hypothetical protein
VTELEYMLPKYRVNAFGITRIISFVAPLASALSIDFGTLTKCGTTPHQ